MIIDSRDPGPETVVDVLAAGTYELEVVFGSPLDSGYTPNH